MWWDGVTLWNRHLSVYTYVQPSGWHKNNSCVMQKAALANLHRVWRKIPYSCVLCFWVCEDVEPPKTWNNNSCAKQKEAGKCWRRKQLNDGYCKRTCGMCPGDTAPPTEGKNLCYKSFQKDQLGSRPATNRRTELLLDSALRTSFLRQKPASVLVKRWTHAFSQVEISKGVAVSFCVLSVPRQTTSSLLG